VSLPIRSQQFLVGMVGQKRLRLYASRLNQSAQSIILRNFRRRDTTLFYSARNLTLSNFTKNKTNTKYLGGREWLIISIAAPIFIYLKLISESGRRIRLWMLVVLAKRDHNYNKPALILAVSMKIPFGVCTHSIIYLGVAPRGWGVGGCASIIGVSGHRCGARRGKMQAYWTAWTR